MTTFSPRLFSTGTLGFALLLGACDGGTSPGTGHLTIRLTDAPGLVKVAVVTISEISLQGGDGRVVLSSDPVTTDLVTLAGTSQTLVQDAVVPDGTYGQLRFVITGAYIEVENSDGSTSIYASSPTYEGLPGGAQVAGALQMPSFAQSGLKVNLPGDALTISDEHCLRVDFDVAQSFGHGAGQSGQWVMHPVINATEVPE